MRRALSTIITLLLLLLPFGQEGFSMPKDGKLRLCGRVTTIENGKPSPMAGAVVMLKPTGLYSVTDAAGDYYIVTSKYCIKLKIIVSLLYHIQHDTIMPIQKYEVSLSAEERKQLTKIVKSGNMPARTILRANILLAVDRNGKQPMTVQEAAIAFNTSATTVQNVRTRYGEKGLDATIQRKKRETPPVEAKVTGDVEAHIIALACGDPPKGYAKWTLRLLADRSVKLGYVESISHTQVGRILKKTSTSLI